MFYQIFNLGVVFDGDHVRILFERSVMGLSPAKPAWKNIATWYGSVVKKT